MKRTSLELGLTLAVLSSCAGCGTDDEPTLAGRAAVTADGERLAVTHGETATGGSGPTTFEVEWDETRNEPIILEDAGGDDRLVVRDVAGAGFGWYALRSGDDLVLRRADEAGFYPYAPTWDGRIVLRGHYADASRRIERVEIFAAPVTTSRLETLARRSFYFNEGRDLSEGSGADEVFWGCYGEDRLAGRGGDDLYKVFGTSETITIVDTSGDDAIELPWRYDSSQIWDIATDPAYGDTRMYVWRQGDDLWFEPAVRVVDFFRARRYQPERLTFSDGTTLARTDLIARAERTVVGTPAAETLNGPPGGAAFDTRGGSDTLRGGAGDDVYRVRIDDEPTVSIRDDGGRDAIVLARAYQPLALTGARHGDDLVLTAADPGADFAVVLEGWARGASRVETIVVPGNPTPAQAVADLAAFAPAALLGGAGADDLRGSGDGELLLGLGGDDLLVGRGGDDVLRGGGGSDLYSFHRDFGHDVVIERPFDDDSADTLELTYWYASELEPRWLGDDLRLDAPDGSSITVRGYLAARQGWPGRPVERVIFGDGAAWSAADLDAAIVDAYRDALVGSLGVSVGCGGEGAGAVLERELGCHAGYTPSEMKDKPATVDITWTALGAPTSVTFDGAAVSPGQTLTVAFPERRSNHQLTLTRADGFSVTYTIDVGWYWVAP